MGMDTGTLVGRRDGGLVDGTYVHENNIYKNMWTDIIYNKLFTHMCMYVSNEEKILKTLFVYEQEFFELILCA